MKKTLGNLLLILGVIVSSLAAGESQRVSRAAAVDDTLVGAVLHSPVRSNYHAKQPDVLVYDDREFDAGRVLSEEDVEWLRTSGIEEVLVLKRATTSKLVPVDEAAVGNVLAKTVVLPKEVEEILAGRNITAAFVQRLKDNGLTEVKIRADHKDAEGKPERVDVVWSLAEGADNPADIELVGSKLGEAITLPVQLKEASYVDANVLARLRASEVSEISVKLPRALSWKAWGARWIFVIGIAITLMGVLLKRARPDVEELEASALKVAHIAQRLSELEGAVERMTGRVEKMDAETIHAEVDKLLVGPVYDIAESRNTIRTAHGGRVFSAVMDAFARGERKLNRTWSAAVDGHTPEARVSLIAALPALREAREALPGTHAPGPSGFDTSHPLPPDVPLAGASDPWGHEG